MRHVNKSNTAIKIFFLLFRKSTHRQPVCTCFSNIFIKQVNGPIGFPEIILISLQSFLICSSLSSSFFFFFSSCFFCLFLFLVRLFLSKHTTFDKLFPILIISNVLVSFLIKQGKSFILFSNFKIAVNKRKQLCLIIDVQLIILTKAAHSLKWQCHQEFACFIVIDYLANIELNDCFACFVNWLAFEYNGIQVKLSGITWIDQLIYNHLFEALQQIRAFHHVRL